jgi:membrane protein implicated in regulation of membrane protease activity
MRLELSPSPALAAALVALHLVAAACVYLVLPDVRGVLLGAGLLALGVAAAWSRALLGAGASVRALELRDRAEAELETRSGKRYASRQGARRYVGRLVVTVPVRKPGRGSVLVSRDMLPGDSFRRLRVWALWGRVPRVAAKQLPG